MVDVRSSEQQVAWRCVARPDTAHCLPSLLQRDAGPLVEEAASQPAAAAAAPAHRATLRVPLPLLAEEDAAQEAVPAGGDRPLAARRLDSQHSGVAEECGEALGVS